MPARTLLLAAALCAPLPALAQHAHHEMPMQHGMPTQHGMPQQVEPSKTAPHEPGQSAFAAIQEIVAILDADPGTDWSKADIEALRKHLVDMDAVTLRTQVLVEPVEGGARFVVTGEGDVPGSIRRMVMAHAATMDGADGWHMTGEERPGGAALTVISPRAADATKIRALGFIGIMTRGMHHQKHHLLLARGMNPHE